MPSDIVNQPRKKHTIPADVLPNDNDVVFKGAQVPKFFVTSVLVEMTLLDIDIFYLENTNWIVGFFHPNICCFLACKE